MQITVLIDNNGTTKKISVDTPGDITEEMIDAMSDTVKRECGTSRTKPKTTVIEKHIHEYHDHWRWPHPYYWYTAESNQPAGWMPTSGTSASYCTTAGETFSLSVAW